MRKRSIFALLTLTLMCKLVWFFIWLFGKMIAGTCSLIKQIFLGAKWGVVKERLEINNEVLCSVLALSITLIPSKR